MKVNKLEEILSSFKDKEAEIFLDTGRMYNYDFGNDYYDLTTVNIEDKDKKTVIKLGFEERKPTITGKNSEFSRIKNMDISVYRDGLIKDVVNE